MARKEKCYCYYQEADILQADTLCLKRCTYKVVTLCHLWELNYFTLYNFSDIRVNGKYFRHSFSYVLGHNPLRNPGKNQTRALENDFDNFVIKKCN